jgi:hypothetical protein
MSLQNQAEEFARRLAGNNRLPQPPEQKLTIEEQLRKAPRRETESKRHERRLVDETGVTHGPQVGGKQPFRGNR